MRNANDLLTRFLKMYQVLEFFTFRLKLIPLTKGQATRNSFISNVRHTVDTISDLGNINESVSYFRDYLNDDNKLYIFLLGGSKSLHSYEPLKNIGAKIYNANNANEFCDMVLTDME